MKRIPFLALVPAALALSACAGTAERPAGANFASAEAMHICEEVDCARMNRISQAARARGVKLIWINPPQKPRAEATAG